MYRYIYRRAVGMGERGHLLYTCRSIYRHAAVMGGGGGSPPIYMYRHIQTCRWNGREGLPPIYMSTGIYRRAAVMGGGHLLYTCTDIYRRAAGMGGRGITSYIQVRYRYIQTSRWNEREGSPPIYM